MVKKLSEICRSNINAADVDEVLKHYLYEKYVIGEVPNSHVAEIATSKTRRAFV